MEAIRLILADASSKKIKVYQMDVKSAFLNDEKKRIETKCGRNKCSISLEEGSRMPPP